MMFKISVGDCIQINFDERECSAVPATAHNKANIRHLVMFPDRSACTHIVSWHDEHDGHYEIETPEGL